MSLSDHLNARQVRGLERVGDVLLPADGSLPSFSQSGCVEDTAPILMALPERDLKDLRLLLSLLSVCPALVIRMILFAARSERFLPDFVGAKLRMILMGLKGLVMLPYYDVPTEAHGFKIAVKETLGYDVAIRSPRDPHDEVTELVGKASPLRADP